MALESGYNVALMAPDGDSGGTAFSKFSANGLSRWASMWNCRRGAGKHCNIQHPTSNIRMHRRSASLKPQASTAQLSSSARTRCSRTGSICPKLGLVIIDEQHKFGVAQRETTRAQGPLSAFAGDDGDADPAHAGLDALRRSGRFDDRRAARLAAGSIKTFVRTADKLPKVWDFIREKLAAGRQAYVVYPRVEESGPNGCQGGDEGI